MISPVRSSTGLSLRPKILAVIMICKNIMAKISSMTPIAPMPPKIEEASAGITAKVAPQGTAHARAMVRMR